MTIKISHSTTGKHKTTKYIATCTIQDDAANKQLGFYIGKHNVTIVQLEIDQKWWIVANRYDEEYEVTDVGPYDTAECAAVMIRLLATTQDHD